MKKYLIDTHAHIDMLISGGNTNINNILSNMNNSGVHEAIIPSVEIGTIGKVVELATNYSNLYGMVGIFPSEVKSYTEEVEENFKQLAKNDKIVAVGEIGLDYYWDKSFVDLQKEVFIKQIRLANQLSLPIVVHDREAHKDTYDILKEYNECSQVLFHCFSGSTEFMKEVTKQGWYIAIGGVVTFKNAVKMKDVAKEVPLDQLVLETDSPYLTPVPYRGKTNEPAYIKFVAEEVAKLRNMPYDELVDITTVNAERFFKI